MPRRSPYAIVLTAAEREELERRARTYTLPYYVVIRAKMILYAADGLENQAISARLDTPREIISHWRQRFFAARVAGLADRPRPGRPAGAADKCE